MNNNRFLLMATGACLWLSGCGDKGPSTQFVRAAVEEKLPPQLAVETVTVEFIPGGDEQGIVRVEGKVRLTEDFFEPVFSNHGQSALSYSSETDESNVRQAAEQKGLKVPPELEKPLSSAKEKVLNAKSAADVPVIKQVHKAGDVFDLSMKGRAIKEGKNWSILGLSGDPPKISGSPRGALASNAALEGDSSVQKAKEALDAARSELEAARTTFVQGLQAALNEKEVAIAKEIAEKKAAFKDACTKEPFYGVWSTERGRGEIGLRFSRFDEVAEENILVEGVFFNPADPKETKLFVGTMSGNGSIEKPYSLRVNVPQGNGVAAQWNAVFNTTTGVLLDECTFDVDLVFDRDLQRLRGGANRSSDGAKMAVGFGSYEHLLQFVFSKSFMPSSQKGDNPGPTKETNNPQEPTSASPEPSTNKGAGKKASGEDPETEPRLLTEADIAGWGTKHIQNALNELYARHGLTFKDKKIQEQFGRYAWYRPDPTLTHDQVEAFFSDVEHANKEFLAAARQRLANTHETRRYSREETKRLFSESFDALNRFSEAFEARDMASAKSAMQTLKRNFPNSPNIYSAEMLVAMAEKDRPRLESAYRLLLDRYTLDPEVSEKLQQIYTTGLRVIKTDQNSPAF